MARARVPEIFLRAQTIDTATNAQSLEDATSAQPSAQPSVQPSKAKDDSKAIRNCCFYSVFVFWLFQLVLFAGTLRTIPTPTIAFLKANATYAVANTLFAETVSVAVISEGRLVANPPQPFEFDKMGLIKENDDVFSFVEKGQGSLELLEEGANITLTSSVRSFNLGQNWSITYSYEFCDLNCEFAPFATLWGVGVRLM